MGEEKIPYNQPGKSNLKTEVAKGSLICVFYV